MAPEGVHEAAVLAGGIAERQIAHTWKKADARARRWSSPTGAAHRNSALHEGLHAAEPQQVR